jgi:hypothetical protein
MPNVTFSHVNIFPNSSLTFGAHGVRSQAPAGVALHLRLKPHLERALAGLLSCYMTAIKVHQIDRSLLVGTFGARQFIMHMGAPPAGWRPPCPPWPAASAACSASCRPPPRLGNHVHQMTQQRFSHPNSIAAQHRREVCAHCLELVGLQLWGAGIRSYSGPLRICRR